MCHAYIPPPAIQVEKARAVAASVTVAVEGNAGEGRADWKVQTMAAALCSRCWIDLQLSTTYFQSTTVRCVAPDRPLIKRISGLRKARQSRTNPSAGRRIILPSRIWRRGNERFSSNTRNKSNDLPRFVYNECNTSVHHQSSSPVLLHIPSVLFTAKGLMFPSSMSENVKHDFPVDGTVAASHLGKQR